MHKITTSALLAAFSLLVGISLASCNTTGGPREGVTSEGFSAPTPVSTVDRTESLRNEYRDWMVR